MKFRTLMWIIAAAVAVVAMAAGVAVFVNRYLNTKKDMDYIECDCEPVPDVLLDEAELFLKLKPKKGIVIRQFLFFSVFRPLRV